ncbi:MAG: branched-chain amino acid ABC transporter permease [Ignavibacteriales bacterium]
MLDYFLQQLANGLAAGSVYALVAVGYSLIYSILELVNFAHGDIYMFGSFVVLTVYLVTKNFALAVVVGAAVSCTVGMTVERIAYRPVRGANRVAPMISAVGAALIIRNLAQVLWGTRTYPFPAVLPQRMIQIGNVTMSTLQISIFGLAMALMIVFSLLVNKTKLGCAVRCVAQDIPTSRLMGIPVNRIISLVYGAGAVLGVFGGVLFAVYYNSVFIGMGFLGTMKAWTAAIIGGIGNIYGACLGGLLLGIVECLASGYISSAYRDAISFGLLIIVLLIRPSGIMGRRVAEKV